MYKLRVIALSFIIATFIPMMAAPVYAQSSVTAFAHLAGTAGPVLTAVTTCAINEITDKVTKYVDKATDKASTITSAVVALGGIVPTNSLDQMRIDIARQRRKQICDTPIERAAAQVILNTITTETVNWINSGKAGSPMYVQDLGSELKKLQTKALGDVFNDLKTNSLNYGDFAKSIAKDTLQQLNTPFQADATYNLNKVIADTTQGGGSAAGFSQNLNLGGWGAFEAGFQPANNPIGFKFQLDSHISNVLSGSTLSPAQILIKKLDWGKGFFSQEKCLDPGWTPDSTSTCIKSKIVTPGSTVADKLNKALGAQQDQLVSGQDLDASITAIFDAMMSTLLTNGIAGLTDSTSNNGSVPSPGGGSTQPTITGNAVAGSACGINSADDWHNQFPKFNLLTDLGDTYVTTQVNGNSVGPRAAAGTVNLTPQIKTYGLISREKILLGLLQQQNDVMNLTIPEIYKLDYCIPGPRPFVVQDMVDATVGNLMQKVDVNSIANDQSHNDYLEIKNAQFLSDNLNIKAFPDSKIKTLDQLKNVIQVATTRYLDAINYTYHNSNASNGYNSIDTQISSAAQDYKLYSKIPAYQQMMADNTAKMNLVQSTIGQLTALKKVRQAFKDI